MWVVGWKMSCSCEREQRLRGVLPPCGEAGFFNGATCVSYHEACVRWSQQQVCDALKCPGQHAHYTGVVNKSPCRGVGKGKGWGRMGEDLNSPNHSHLSLHSATCVSYPEVGLGKSGGIQSVIGIDD